MFSTVLSFVASFPSNPAEWPSAAAPIADKHIHIDDVSIPQGTPTHSTKAARREARGLRTEIREALSQIEDIEANLTNQKERLARRNAELKPLYHSRENPLVDAEQTVDMALALAAHSRQSLRSLKTMSRKGGEIDMLNPERIEAMTQVVGNAQKALDGACDTALAFLLSFCSYDPKSDRDRPRVYASRALQRTTTYAHAALGPFLELAADPTAVANFQNHLGNFDIRNTHDMAISAMIAASTAQQAMKLSAISLFNRTTVA